MKKESGEKDLLPVIEKWKTYYGRYNELNGTTVDEVTALMWLETYSSNVSQLENVSSMSKAMEKVLRRHTSALGINLPSDCTVGLESLLALHTHTAQQFDIKQKKEVLLKRETMVAQLRCVNAIRHAYSLVARHTTLLHEFDCRSYESSYSSSLISYATIFWIDSNLYL